MLVLLLYSLFICVQSSTSTVAIAKRIHKQSNEVLSTNDAGIDRETLLIMPLYIGYPSVKFKLALDFDFSDIIVVDVRCGLMKSDSCQRYCSNSFFVIYCPVECHEMTPQSSPLYCTQNKHPRYDASKSEMARNLTEPKLWKGQLNGLRKMYGHYVRDVIKLGKAYLKNDTYPPTELTVLDAHFVSGLQLDTRCVEVEIPSNKLFSVYGDLTGGPRSRNGEESIILQAYRANMIPAPFAVTYQQSKGEWIFYFGEYDGKSCTDFGFANLYGDKFSWTIEAEVRINGVLMKRKQTLSVSSTVYMLHLPSDVLKYLMSENFVFSNNSAGLYLNNSFTIEFTLDDGSSFLIKKEFLLHTKSNNMTIIAPTPTTNASQFIEPDYLIGFALMPYYCFYFDYGQLRLGIAYSTISGNN